MVTYDTKEVAIQKSEFVRDWHLGGAMWWESSGDKSGPDSLIATVSVPDPVRDFRRADLLSSQGTP
jgi:GH18 family chitinase